MQQRTGPFWDFLAGRVPPPPAARTLGWELESVEPEAGTIAVRFTAGPEFLNPWGKVQGGFLAAMLDDTLGAALVATLGPGESAPTLELKVNYLRPAGPGVLHGRGRVVHRTGSTGFLAGELVDDEGRELATATATARIFRSRQFRCGPRRGPPNLEAMITGMAPSLARKGDPVDD
ncbi:PaaI family thioesterase [Amycolatopsis acidicola]|uniref:PaaI family thioesterase n=1 Tax=Amycolatopsis acidicola TaxID=2596893 RepID=UPI001FB66D76|nr:PaaI family thioesterase [Amycolatopsis acidicola]